MGVKIGHKPKLTPIAYLEARDPTNNVHRAYSLAYGQDLFGNWVVETTYGRIGGNEAEALQYVQKSFKRRQSAPKRIGVTYKVRTTLDSDQ